MSCSPKQAQHLIKVFERTICSLVTISYFIHLDIHVNVPGERPCTPFGSRVLIGRLDLDYHIAQGASSVTVNPLVSDDGSTFPSSPSAAMSDYHGNLLWQHRAQLVSLINRELWRLTMNGVSLTRSFFELGNWEAKIDVVRRTLACGITCPAEDRHHSRLHMRLDVIVMHRGTFHGLKGAIISCIALTVNSVIAGVAMVTVATFWAVTAMTWSCSVILSI
ncbi:hypothetical protein EV363DRAFT_1297030 [Boletus edulis]|nr:hypothetical protein EV363DRAFT_1297030 [Boletus edulis]